MFYLVCFSIALRSKIILTNFRPRFLGRERIFALLQCFYAERARGKRAIAGNERSEDTNGQDNSFWLRLTILSSVLETRLALLLY